MNTLLVSTFKLFCFPNINYPHSFLLCQLGNSGYHNNFELKMLQDKALQKKVKMVFGQITGAATAAVSDDVVFLSKWDLYGFGEVPDFQDNYVTRPGRIRSQ